MYQIRQKLNVPYLKNYIVSAEEPGINSRELEKTSKLKSFNKRRNQISIFEKNVLILIQVEYFH